MTITTKLLEIERKFAFRPSLLSRFRNNNGTPQFRSLEYLGRKRIRDEYFNLPICESDGGTGWRVVDTILARKGIWVRKRNGVW